MKNITLLLALFALSACAPDRENTNVSDEVLVPIGGDDGDAWFLLHSPQLRDADGDGIWTAGEQITMDLLFTNQREDHNYYPGVLASTDVDNVAVDSSENWWFGIVAGDTYEANLAFTADSTVSDGTIVTLIASASSLACDNDDPLQAPYCPDPNPLLVPVRIGDRLPEL